MMITCKRDDFMDDEIEDFQDLMNEWFDLYINLLDLEGITNYMHLLGAGHLYFYLKKLRSLYCYKQQGWESKNGKISHLSMDECEELGQEVSTALITHHELNPLYNDFSECSCGAQGGGR